MKILGILLILNGIAVSSWWVTSQGTHKGTVVTLCLVAVFAGLALVLSDRITELSVKGVGTIKAAAQQAESDASTVSDLKKRVESQSATVDLVAQQAKKAEELSQEASEKNEKAEAKLKTLDEAIAKASKTLESLESVTEYTKTVVAAQNDDREAFDTLEAWSKDKSHPFSEEAGQAWSTVFESHNKPFSTSGFTVPWNEGFDPSVLTLPQLASQYATAPPQLKPALLEYIWKRNDIPQIDRLDFMMNIMKTDDSLTAVEYAGRHFTSGTKQKIKPMAVEYLDNWWKEHRSEFKDEKSNNDRVRAAP